MVIRDSKNVTANQQDMVVKNLQIRLRKCYAIINVTVIIIIVGRMENRSFCKNLGLLLNIFSNSLVVFRLIAQTNSNYSY